MSAITEQRDVFFTVKARLDHYCLPTHFHLEDIFLIQKLLSRLDSTQEELTALKADKNIIRRLDD